MPSTTSSSVSAVFASSTVMTPSLPTFFIALAIISPTAASPFEAIVPIWPISSEEPTFLARFSISFVTAYGDIDAALQVHRVHAGGNELDAFLHDRGRKHGRCRRAVAGEIVGLRGNFAHHLCAHILELVGELDLLRHRHTVLGDARGTVGFIDHDVAALRAERHFDGVVECLDTVQKPVACVGGESNVLCSHDLNFLFGDVADAAQAAFLSLAAPSITPSISDSFMIRRSSPSIFTSVPDHLPNRTRAPALTSRGTILPLSSRAPGPTAMTSPSCGFSLTVSGMMMPPLVFSP